MEATTTEAPASEPAPVEVSAPAAVEPTPPPAVEDGEDGSESEEDDAPVDAERRYVACSVRTEKHSGDADAALAEKCGKAENQVLFGVVRAAW